MADWGDLSWLQEHGYHKTREADDYGPERWMRRVRVPARPPSRHDWFPDVVISFTGHEHGQQYAQASAALVSDDGCVVVASLDEIDFDRLRTRLAWYEQRVIEMAEFGASNMPKDEGR